MLSTQDKYAIWSGAVKKKFLNSPEDFRRQRHSLNSLGWQYNNGTIQIIEHAGWHFTYLGNESFAKNKIQSFSHSDDNRPEILNQINIDESIKQGRGIIQHNSDYLFCPVAVDDYLPDSIVKNQIKYKDFLLTGITQSARDLLPQ
jgi:hypothetical protein